MHTSCTAATGSLHCNTTNSGERAATAGCSCSIHIRAADFLHLITNMLEMPLVQPCGLLEQESRWNLELGRSMTD